MARWDGERWDAVAGHQRDETGLWLARGGGKGGSASRFTHSSVSLDMAGTLVLEWAEISIDVD